MACNLDSAFRIVNITMIPGDTLAFDMIFTEATTLTAATFVVSDSSGTAEATLSIGSGITKTDDKTYRVKMPPTTTSGLAVGKHAYKLTISFSVTDVYTLLVGKLIMTEGVTL